MENATMKDFSLYSTARYEGFTEAELSRLERIMLNIFAGTPAQKVLAFFDDLIAHIDEKKSHQLQLTEEEYSKCLYQLFKMYRLLGNTGTVQDMILAIGKQIKVAVEDDLLIGHSTTLAVPVTLWRILFNEHSNDIRAHKQLFDLLKKNYVETSVTVVSLTNLIPENYNPDITYPFPWHRFNGTLVSTFTYTEDTSNLFTLQGYVDTFSFIIKRTPYTRLTCYINDIETGSIPLHADSSKETLLLSYNNSSWYMRTLLKEVYFIIPLKSMHLNKIYLDAGIKTFDSLVYYKKWIDSEDAVTLLNP